MMKADKVATRRSPGPLCGGSRSGIGGDLQILVTHWSLMPKCRTRHDTT
jgi:hypothetical protein